MMDNEIKDILQCPTMLGLEGRYIVRDELARDADISAILTRLPLVERFRLYAFLTNPHNPEIEGMTDDAFYAAVSMVGRSIDFKESDAVKAAVQSVVGRTQLREKQSIPVDNKNGFDGYQNGKELMEQLYLALVVSVFLPAAFKETPASFVSTRLSEAEQGSMLAILQISREDGCREVLNALEFISQNMRFSPTSWNSFQSTCAELEKNPENLVKKTSALVDTLVEREIHRLSPSDIAELSDQQVYHYVQALGWWGDITPSFRIAQQHLYKNLAPTNAIRNLREQQIDAAVEHFSGMSAEQVLEWQSIKDTWSQQSLLVKESVLEDYVLTFGSIIKTPQVPEVSVTSWNNAPDKPESLSNGYFFGWKFNKVGDKSTTVWINTIYLIDDIDANGIPLSVSRSLRSALNVATHEALHSDDEQTRVRFNRGSAKFAAYADALGVPANELQETKISDPMGYTAGLLHEASSGRMCYVPSEISREIYHHQPFEKFVWTFQNQFVASLNGTLVARQVEANQRSLRDELRQMFKKAAHVLTARKEITATDDDIVPLEDYKRSEHPFGTLSVLDGETVEKGFPAEDNGDYVAIDFSSLGGRMNVLTYLQGALDRLEAREATKEADYFPLYRQSADFLVQMPSEIWAIKKTLGHEGKPLADKLESLARKNHELGEDLSDFIFIVGRKEEIDQRKQSKEAQRAERRNAVSRLTAVL
ncbi:MAG: hypothetical protein IPI58_08950 [Alphaproteobacteria bacterium]|nr:MAG: hypothetical protein IPI58_08950 [Alphaproteobacteria bacterium]